MMMKELLSPVLILTMVSVASATTVTLVPIEEGDPGSATNPLAPSDTVVIPVYSDFGLIGLDAILEVDGPATIVGAISKADCADYGWDPSLSFDPSGVPSQSVEICVGNFGGSPPGLVGYFLIRCDDSGPAILTLSRGCGCGCSDDVDFREPTITGQIVVYQAAVPTCWDAAECAGQPYGDALCDGHVDLADVFAMKAHFGRCAPWSQDPTEQGQCCADFDHSGCVDLGDLYVIKANFGTGGYSPSTGNQNCP